MNGTELLITLLQRGVQLWTEDQQVRYRAPREALTPDVRAAFATHRPEILAALHGEARYAQLSFAQQRLWFLNQLVPDNPFYNLPNAFQLRGELDTAALERTLNDIVRRHEILRTTFSTIGSLPVQVIAPASSASVRLPLLDLRHLPPAERQQETQRMLLHDAQRPFHLGQGPLVRALLLRTADQEHILLLTLHHIVYDGWSVGVLANELATLYAAFASGAPAPLPALTWQYADFATWQQRQVQQDGRMAAHLAYWQQQLADLPALHLPTDFPRPTTPTFAGTTHRLHLPAELVAQLRTLARQHGATLYMVLLAALSVLLARYSNQDEVAISAPITNRSRAETEPLIGFMVNNLVLRCNLAANPTFAMLLERVRQTALDAYAHQDAPFERLVELVQPDRQVNQSPLFQVALSVEAAPLTNRQAAGLRISQIEQYINVARLDLELHFWERPGEPGDSANGQTGGQTDGQTGGQAGGLDGVLLYSTELFSAATIEQMMTHYRHILQTVASNPALHVGTLPLLSPEERQRVLVEWNSTAETTDTAPDEALTARCMHWLFEQHASTTPDAPALVAADPDTRAVLSYRELNRRANRLAHTIAARLEHSLLDTPVGLFLERSPEAIIGLLAILKVGGAYLPLDPDYPPERLRFMLADARPPLLLTTQALLSALPLPADYQPQIICLDTDWPHIASHPEDSPDCPVTPDNLAYIIYTSGSTGQPKGVLLAHRGVDNVVQAQRRLPGVQPGARVLQFSSLNFDASVFEIVMALCTGATLVLARRELLLPGPDLLHLLREQAISHLTIPPSALAALPPAADLPDLHTLLVAGEALPAALVARWLRGRRLFNLYGPTETTIWATFYECGPQDAASDTPPPIGRPIRNTRAYVLDASCQPVPPGVTGELYIGGPGVTWGYLNRPDLTAERLLPDPFSSDRTARLYRTGDLARYRRDGTLEFLGRADDQVKLRGFRIEPGEIAAVLRRHPAITDAAVVLHDQHSGNPQLAAYLVPTADWKQQASTERHTTLEQDYISQWQALYDTSYADPTGTSTLPPTTPNLTGWRDSYSGQPIPAEQMHAWIDRTVERIQTLRPRRVLEIGCGAGLLLLPLAPHVESYVGTDLSPVALDYLRGRVLAASPDTDMSHVALYQQPAHEIDSLPDGTFDTIILNSVVQYFPSSHYLLHVLEQAIARTAPGGTIFVGDVRSYDLLETLHTTIQLAQAPDTLPLADLRASIQQQLAQEEELTLAPALWLRLADDSPTIGRRLRRVQTLLKRGEQHNELNRFRYDVILSLDTPATPPTDGSDALDWQDWQQAGLSLASLPERLSRVPTRPLALRNIPDARIAPCMQAVALLHQPDSELFTAGDVRRAVLAALSLDAPDTARPVDPEDLYRLGESLGYRVVLAPAFDTPGLYNALFAPAALAATADMPTPPEPLPARPLHELCNAPLAVLLRRHLLREVRATLAERLPDYMQPAAYMLLERLPLTPNGKLDKNALPAPESRRTTSGTILPRTPDEQAIAAVWAELLDGGQPGQIGIHDSFFDLGGHSLLATQLIYRLRDMFGVDIPLRRLFDTPTIAGLTAELEQQRRMHTWGTTPTPLPALTSDPAHQYAPFPLTDIQQAYWASRSGAFELSSVATHGYQEIEQVHFDVQRFEWAWNQLIQRHAMLRAVMTPDGQQRILPDVPWYTIAITDLRGLDEQTVMRRLHSIRDIMSHQVLPMEQYPLFDIRATLLDGNRTRIHSSLDGLIVDAWSALVLGRDLHTLYSTPQASLPPLQITFRDYVLAQRSLRESALYQRSRDYWLQRLPDLPPAPALPLAHNPATLKQPRFKRYSARLEPDIWQQLQQRAARANITPTGVLLAAFAEVLAVWSEQPAFTINMTFFNRLRMHPQVNELIGDFTAVNLLAVDASTPEPFEARAQRIQQQVWHDLDNAYMSGVEVLRELVRRNGNTPGAHMPVVFTSVLSQSKNSTDRPALFEQQDVIYTITQTPQVWLDYKIYEAGGSLMIDWDVLQDLFPAGMVDDMFAAHSSLVQRLATDEQSWHTTHRTLLPPDQQRQRQQTNATEAHIPDELAQTRFLAHARHHPQHPAVITSRGSLSYGQVQQRANQLGRHLRNQGAQPDRLVAIVMEKGWEQVVAVLGILQAGAAYLPIDPDSPAERVRALLENGEVTIVLTQERLRRRLALPPAMQTICVDGEALLRLDDSPLPPVQRPGNLAYVIYTSGSTGEPKGVMIEHRSVVNRFLDVNERYGISPGDRVLALTALHHDLACYDMLGVLMAGGTIVLPDADQRLDPRHWADMLQRERVTLWNSVPAYLEMLVEYLEQQPPAAHPAIPFALRLALLAGDWIPTTLPQRLWRCLPDVRLIAAGGPTETTTWDICFPVDHVEPDWPSIPYGRPMRNAHYYVLHDTLDDCPTWVAGELYIGGAGLARGYWRNPQQTSARFLAHPRTGERLYRSGDMGRYLPDGTIQFLGRSDFQVKIRGQRIELGEIEALLMQHPTVRAAVATVQGSGLQRRLVAYVVPAHPDAPPDPRQVRAFLATRLPESMLPAALLTLEQLPLTANGKVDRRALPAADRRNSLLALPVPEPHENGTSSPHSRIGELVGRVLATEESLPADLSPEANLLEIGATSIDLIRIANLLEQELGFRPGVGDLYNEPTIAALARAYQRQQHHSPPRSTAQPTTQPAAPPATPPQPEPLQDRDERAAFKQQQRAIRRIRPTDTTVELPAPSEEHQASLHRLYQERRSYRQFAAAPLALADLAGLLAGLRQMSLDGQPKYLYPSGGGLYPVQTYLHIQPGQVEGLAGGAYSYHPVEHRLVLLAGASPLEAGVHEPFINRPIFEQAAFSLFLVASYNAITPLYGDLARDFCLLEAGYIGQLLLMLAPRHQIGLCPIGSLLSFAPLISLLHLASDQEVVHSFVGGRIPATDRAASQSAVQPALPLPPLDVDTDQTEREEGEI